MYRKASRLLFFLLLAAPTLLLAQNLSKSPYSVIGIGDMHFGGSAAQSAMGQLGQSVRLGFQVNTLNPASYDSLQQTVFEVGALYATGTISNNSSRSNVENYSFSYFKLAFPLSQKLKWGFAFGLEPYSNIGYNVSSNVTYPDFPATITQVGTGGLTRFFGGSGIAVNKHFSVGVNGSYIFGQLKRTKSVYIPVEYNKFNLSEETRQILKGFQLQYGVQYHTNLGSKYRMNAGATYTQSTNLSGQQEFFVRSMGLGGTSAVRDTITYSVLKGGSIVLPWSAAVGIGFQKQHKWFAGAEVTYTNWEQFRSFGSTDSLKNSLGLSAGFSWTPDYANYMNYFKRIEYRLGGRFDNGNLNIYGHDIVSYGVSAGIGLPLSKASYSRLNISFEYYSKGTTSSDLIRENYYRVVLGIAISDRWFRRVKYD